MPPLLPLSIRRAHGIVLLMLLFFGLLPLRADDVWQYSVPIGKDPIRRAYLWIPPKCEHVRGVIVGIQNMLEQSIFEDPSIRAAAADSGLGIMWITPADDTGSKDEPYHRFQPGAEVAAGVDKALADLADESGYAELKGAPLMITGHSAATPFVYGMAAVLGPRRVIAIFPIRGWIQSVPAGIPAFQITSEWAEVGGEKWGEVWTKDRDAVQRVRTEGGDDCLFGSFVDIGVGHYDWNPKVAPVIAMFIRKAAAARLPTTIPPNGSAVLKPIASQTGWLIDPQKLGTPGGSPVPCAQWKGDPKHALWYIDREMAETVNKTMMAQLAKKREVIDFVDAKGSPVPLDNTGAPGLPLQWLPDGVTFRVAATFLDQAPSQLGGDKLGHAPGPILFKIGSGAIKQMGPDTFRIWMKRGGLVKQGSPWDPWVIAYQEGDSEYRSADRPGHPWLYAENKDGKPQTITFPAIPDRPYGPGTLTLVATSDSGLPVQFYMVSGPAELSGVENTTLKFVAAPLRSKFPIRVIVGAYQWGRINGGKIQSAGPVFRTFYLTR